MELIIQDNQIEVEKISVKVSVGVKELKRPDARKSSKSSTIVIPDTEGNRQGLSQAYDFRSRNLQTFKGSLQHGTFSLPGVFILNEVKVKGKEVELRGVLKGDSFVWADRIKTSSMKDLVIGCGHEFNTTNLEASLDGSLPYLYYLADYNQFVQDTTTGFTVRLSDMFPGLNVKNILEAIFFDYTIESNWLNTYDNLFTSFLGSPFITTEKDVEALKYYVGMNRSFSYTQEIEPGSEGDTLLLFDSNTADTTVVPFNNVEDPFFDNGDNFDVVNNYFTVPASGGSMNFATRVDLNFNYRDTATNLDVTLEIISKPNAASGSETVEASVNETQGVGFTKPYYLKTPILATAANQVYFVRLTVTGIAVNDEGVHRLFRLVIKMDDSYFRNFPVRRRATGFDWTDADLLPERKQIDFLKGLTQAFNLMFITNEHTKTIFIEKEKDFYESESVDWSSYISEEYKMTPAQIPSILYALAKDDKDGSLLDYKLTNGEKNLFTYFPPNQNVNKETVSRNVFFAPTIGSEIFRLGIEVVCPLLWKEAELGEWKPDYDFKPRFFLHEGVEAWVGSVDVYPFGDIPILNTDVVDFAVDYATTNRNVNELFDISISGVLPESIRNNLVGTGVQSIRFPIWIGGEIQGFYWVESCGFDIQTGKFTSKILVAQKNSY